MLHPRAEILLGGELHEEVHVSCIGVGVGLSGRAKNLQPNDVVAAAEVVQGIVMVFEKRDHGYALYVRILANPVSRHFIRSLPRPRVQGQMATLTDATKAEA